MHHPRLIRSAACMAAVMVIAACSDGDASGSDDAEDPAAFAEEFCPALVQFFGAFDSVGDDTDDVAEAQQQVRTIADSVDDLRAAARAADVTPDAAEWRTELVEGLRTARQALEEAAAELTELDNGATSDDITAFVLDRVEEPFAEVFAAPGAEVDGELVDPGVLYDAPDPVLDALRAAPGCRQLISEDAPPADQPEPTTTTLAGQDDGPN